MALMRTHYVKAIARLKSCSNTQTTHPLVVVVAAWMVTAAAAKAAAAPLVPAEVPEDSYPGDNSTQHQVYMCKQWSLEASSFSTKLYHIPGICIRKSNNLSHHDSGSEV